MNTSAGILMYRRNGGLEVLLVHPGGPFWARKDAGAWSIPKGEFDARSEDPWHAACREFEEEVGHAITCADPIDLGEIVQRAGKTVRAFGVEGDLDVATVVSNTFEMEWPPGSGRRQAFPEVDRAGWFGVRQATERINPAQVELLERLIQRLG